MHLMSFDHVLTQHLRVARRKTIHMWHPNESAKFYMDHIPKFGLSPVNVDRVDLQRFPEVANAATFVAELEPGDAVYIPYGW